MQYITDTTGISDVRNLGNVSPVYAHIWCSVSRPVCDVGAMVSVSDVSHLQIWALFHFRLATSFHHWSCVVVFMYMQTHIAHCFHRSKMSVLNDVYRFVILINRQL